MNAGYQVYYKHKSVKNLLKSYKRITLTSKSKPNGNFTG